MTDNAWLTDVEKFTLPDHARVWIFQSDRFLTDEETDIISQNGKRFAAQWKAHGKSLSTEFEVINKLFLVMAVDEEVEGASGCSIDTFMRFVLEAEKQLGLNLTNRLCFAFENNGTLFVCKREQAKEMIESGTFTKDHLVFDNLVKTLGELRSEWCKPANTVWTKQFFN